MNADRPARVVFSFLTVLGVVLISIGLVGLTFGLLALREGRADVEGQIMLPLSAISSLGAGGFSLYAAKARYRGGWRTAIAVLCLLFGVNGLAVEVDNYYADVQEDPAEGVIVSLGFLVAGALLAQSGYKRHLRVALEGETSVQRAEDLETEQYPSILRRYLSTVIDVMFILSAFVALSALLQDDHFLRAGITLSLFFLYEPLFTSTLCTVGQKLTGIRVRSFKTHAPISLPAAYVRIIVKLLLGIISFFTIPVSQGRRGIHDLAAGSIVVYAEEDGGTVHHSVAQG